MEKGEGFCKVFDECLSMFILLLHIGALFFQKLAADVQGQERPRAIQTLEKILRATL